MQYDFESLRQKESHAIGSDIARVCIAVQCDRQTPEPGQVVKSPGRGKTLAKIECSSGRYTIANLRLGMKGERDNGDRWSATLFVNNLTNNIVLLDPQPQISLQDGAFSRYVVSQPLTAGIDVSYTFQ